MAKRKPEVEIYSYGIYSKWESTSKEIPKLLEITQNIPCEVDVEFGYHLKIKKAKGAKIRLENHHPPIKDEKGNLMPVFRGELIINSNNFDFFQGDTIWDPIHDKAGTWTCITWIDGVEVARKSFDLVLSKKK